MRLFDAHNHFHQLGPGKEQTEAAEVLGELQLAGAAVNGTCEGDWQQVMDLKFPWAMPQLGLHPWHVGNRSDRWRERLLEQLSRGAGVGEVGLDRWILDRARPDDPRLQGLRRAPLQEQREVFLDQWAIATHLKRPVSVHCLDAWNDLVPLLLSETAPVPGFLLHAYSGPAAAIEPLARKGAYFSFNGAFALDLASARAQAFRTIPRDRLLVETDAPSFPLAPSLRRFSLPDDSSGGARNHPANLQVAYEALSGLLAMPLDALTAQVEANFRRLFGTR